MEFLNLLDNEELCPLTKHLKTACAQHEIRLSMDIEKADYVTPTSSMTGLTKNDVAPAAARNHTEATFVSSFTPEQVQNITTFTSSLTQEQRQSVISLFTFLASDQAQHVRNFFSNVPLEVATLVHHQLQMDLKTLFELLDPQQSFQRFAMLSFEERIGKGIVLILRNIGSTFTPEQWQTLNSITRSLTPQQIHTVMTLILWITPQTTQTMVNLISSDTPEEAQTMLNLLSRVTPEAEVGDISSSVHTDNSASQDQMGNDVAQNMATLVSNFFQSRSSSTPKPEIPTREAPQSQFDFSAVRNLVHTFFDTDNKAKQAKPQVLTENSQRPSHAPQPQFDFSSIRNLVHTFFDIDNSTDQDQPQERKEDSQQKRKHYRDDLDLD